MCMLKYKGISSIKSFLPVLEYLLRLFQRLCRTWTEYCTAHICIQRRSVHLQKLLSTKCSALSWEIGLQRPESLIPAVLRYWLTRPWKKPHWGQQRRDGARERLSSALMQPSVKDCEQKQHNVLFAWQWATIFSPLPSTLDVLFCFLLPGDAARTSRAGWCAAGRCPRCRTATSLYCCAGVHLAVCRAHWWCV